MNTFVTILIAVLVFGFLIFIHEFGHFIFARIFGVTVREFSIGMGPKLLTYTSKKSGTTYALSMLPFGGYVAMEGEDAESSDPNSFSAKPAWQRFIITAAGAFVNLLVGFLILVIISLCTTALPSNRVAVFLDKTETGYEVSSSEDGLRVDDVIVAVGDRRVQYAEQISYEIMRFGYEPVDLTVIRDGETIVLEDVTFPVSNEQGQVFGMMDFKVYGIRPTFGQALKYSVYKTGMIIRMCWESIFDLIRGRYTIEAVSGPVGISSALGEAASQGFATLLSMVVMISINLGVFNLLPIPALDGGRLVTILIEMVTRRRMPAKVEGIINGVGLTVLLLFSIFIFIKDIIAQFI